MNVYIKSSQIPKQINGTVTMAVLKFIAFSVTTGVEWSIW